MINKICPYVQNQQKIVEKYTYNGEGQVETFTQDTFKGNAICVRELCVAWDEGRCRYNGM